MRHVLYLKFKFNEKWTRKNCYDRLNLGKKLFDFYLFSLCSRKHDKNLVKCSFIYVYTHYSVNNSVLQVIVFKMF